MSTECNILKITKMIRNAIELIFFCLTSLSVSASEYHVAKSGKDTNAGTHELPLLTIQAAADIAMPGDIITVHQGVYREEITPPRGGNSDDKRITYRAAPGEMVTIKGSEIIEGWEPEKEGVWKVRIPNSFFGDFNPYADEISGDWFNPGDRKHHTGCVYSDGMWLFEAASLENVFGNGEDKPSWFAEVDETRTTIWANFGSKDPNKSLTEINVRQTVFYPRKPFQNYITVKGFRMCHAAPRWAPPTAEQMGLIGTHWSKGWIIEDNDISHSINAGISLGKYGDEYDNLAPTAAAYLSSIDRARENGWNKKTIGSHIVRNNTISYCEQVGIVGSMGASFSQVIGNHIHHIHIQARFTGAEMAGIKFHAPIDVLIQGNRIHDAGRAIWLDWMTQGTRVTQNLCYHNGGDDMFLEVNHGPCVIDNNIFLSRAYRNRSQGMAFAHNLFGGEFDAWLDTRRATPYFKPHSTEKIDDHKIDLGDAQFYNNIFIGDGSSGPAPSSHNLMKISQDKGQRVIGYGLWVYDSMPTPPGTGGNLYCFGAQPFKKERNEFIQEEDPSIRIVEEEDGVYLYITMGEYSKKGKTKMVTTKLLGKSVITRTPYQNYDGSPLIIDTDYFGNKRNLENPTPGPFEDLEQGRIMLKVW
jgi:alpha-N-arabinofuranosidase